MVLKKLDDATGAEALLAETLALDPLDWWACRLAGGKLSCDSHTVIDIVHDIARAGLYADALELLNQARPEPTSGTAPVIRYTRAWLLRLTGDAAKADAELKQAADEVRDYCFPFRVEDVIILEWAISENLEDAQALYYLGNLFYDRKRHHDAMALWKRSAELDPNNSIVWRNLGVGYWNVVGNPEKAYQAYERAWELAPNNARLLFERDLLWKRMSTPAGTRLEVLEQKLELVMKRDDLSVEYSDLLNQVGRHEDARDYLQSRRFQPWEGGEGLARGQHERTHLALGRQQLATGDAEGAMKMFEAALICPPNLGETKHLLANRSDIDYWRGCAAEALGCHERARSVWQAAADFRSDFQERAVRMYSEMTYFSGLALRKLGCDAEADELFKGLKEYARKLFKEEAKVYYFATSLPARLLFYDLQYNQETTALLIEAQAELGLGNKAEAAKLLKNVLERNPALALAQDLLAEIRLEGFLV
eukprot:TRINITY_DN8769_c0_g1_i14.p1 TRINITY_DN8769_c0_g1~~TRINITY_DN8769_c0_g1_i14.p1  ORF type:complete len:479 (+),score=123.85 TRINITY_DN8769_c0_g1_i14:914-2350(+)